MELTQEEVRRKLKKYYERETLTAIAQHIGIPNQVLSLFRLNKKNLWDSSLKALNDYLDELLDA